MVTAAALLDTQKGPIIGIFHEYAHVGKRKSIHDAGQMEWFNCKVRIEKSDGYVIPEFGVVYM